MPILGGISLEWSEKNQIEVQVREVEMRSDNGAGGGAAPELRSLFLLPSSCHRHGGDSLLFYFRDGLLILKWIF